MAFHNIVSQLIICISIYSTNAYKGKVFDSTPKVRNDPLLTMEINLNDYLGRIDNQDQVVVFPEYGLTSLDVFSTENMTKYGLEIPAVDVSVSICEQKAEENPKSPKIISALSCAAAEKNIYLVANLIEKDKKDFYNTNLVFNKKGALIAKYRKINLIGDEITYMKAGEEIVTFETEFGTFGTFTCNDIMNKRPALDILQKEDVKNILFPTAWFSVAPFWASLAVQDGYAKRTGVNLLASSYNAPKFSNGGAGIYLGRQEKSVHIQGLSGTAAVILEIGVPEKGRPECAVMETSDSVADSRALPTADVAKQFVMGNYFIDHAKYVVHEALSIETKSFETNLCTSDKKLCCQFTAKIFNDLIEEDPKYKFVAYSRNQDYACGLVSCATDDITSCGKPISGSKDNNFSFLKIAARPKDLEAYDMPSTLRYNLRPVESYKYCSSPGNVTVELENQNSLMAFGVMFSAATNVHSVVLITIISLITSRIF